jgi:gentisate 1,2-dioxygenase
VVWLDVLDLPIVYYMEASYHIPGERQDVKPSRGDRAWSRAGVVPSPVFERSSKRYPVLRYPWAEARAALLGLAADQPETWKPCRSPTSTPRPAATPRTSWASMR